MQHHDVVMVAAGDLVLAEYNPRTITPDALEALKRSLTEYGFVQPLVARRKDLLLIGGHQRLAAFRGMCADRGEDCAKALVPVVLLDIDDAKARALNLALNKISGDWDYTRLHDVLADLQTSDAGLLSLTGFSDNEVSDILSLLGTSASASEHEHVDDETLDALVDNTLWRIGVKYGSKAEYEEVMDLLAKHGPVTNKHLATTLLAALRTAVPQPQPAPAPPKTRKTTSKKKKGV